MINLLTSVLYSIGLFCGSVIIVMGTLVIIFGLMEVVRDYRKVW